MATYTTLLYSLLWAFFLRKLKKHGPSTVVEASTFTSGSGAKNVTVSNMSCEDVPSTIAVHSVSTFAHKQLVLWLSTVACLKPGTALPYAIIIPSVTPAALVQP